MNEATTPGQTRLRLSPINRKSSATRIPALDGLRGLAILLVLILHLRLAFDLSGCWLDRAAMRLISQCWIGVDIFFVLSGFLITGILLGTKTSDHYWRNFYARRTLRIFPLYYAFLFLYLIVFPHISVFHRIQEEQQAQFPQVPHSQLWYWFYASNILFAWKGEGLGLGVTWSLAVEEQFYLFWPIVVACLSGKQLAVACCSILAGCLCLRALASCWGISYPATYMLLPTHMDGLIVGALISLPVHQRTVIGRDLKLVWIAGGVGLITLVSLMVWSARRGHDVRYDLFTQVPVYTVLAIAVGCLMVIILSGGRLAKLLSARSLRQFGKYSYSLYLFHRPVCAALGRMTKLDQRPVIFGSRLPALAAHYVLCIGVLYVLSFITWHVYEKQFLKLQRFFPSRSHESASQQLECIA